MNRWAWTGMVALTSAAIGAGGTWAWMERQRAQATDMRTKLENRIRVHLNDPESARFQFIEEDRTSKALCASVNAKNRMGGYTGYRDMILMADGTFLLAPDDDKTGTPTQRLANLQEQLVFLETAGRECANVGPAAAAASGASTAK